MQSNLVRRLGQVEPMLHVLAKVVTKEGTHGERVVHDRLGRMFGGGGRLRLELHANEDTVRPGERLVDKWHALRTTAAKDERLDGYTRWILPLRMNDRALCCDRREAAVRMRRLARFADLPLLAQPRCDRAVLKCLFRGVRCDKTYLVGNFVLKTLPKHMTIVGLSRVGEDAVALARLHRHRIRLVVGARCDAEEARLGINTNELAVFAEAHPRNVVADAANLSV